MSFFDTPGTDGYNSVTREEAINLLLTSVAQEEAGLSKLMDAERNKLLYTINRYRHGKCDLRNVLEINKSVDSTIKNMIKYQMLLQHKLENIKELLASYPAESKPRVNATHNRCGTAAAKCKTSAAPASSKTGNPSPGNSASTGTDPAYSANAGSAPKHPIRTGHARSGTADASSAHNRAHQKYTGTLHAYSKCRPAAAQTNSKECPPSGNSASTGTDPSYVANAGSAPKPSRSKYAAAWDAGPNRPGLKSSAPKRPDHPEPTSSAQNDPAVIKKKCGLRPCPCNRKPAINTAQNSADIKKTAEHNACSRKPVINSACRPARRKAANRQAAMLRALLFCFLPFCCF